MLISFGHGTMVPLEIGQTGNKGTSFDYFFKDAPVSTFTESTLEHLTALHRDMVETDDDAMSNHSSLPPVFTYFGQFIDHDITGTSSDGALPKIEDPALKPVPRDQIVSSLKNTRTGRLDLDSLYGSSEPSGNAALDKMVQNLRFPSDRAKMWIGQFWPSSRRVQFPLDEAGDVLRLGHLLDSPLSTFNEADLHRLPDAHKANFLDGDGKPRRARAIIGDARNDENLFIAQLHLAFLRFHNRLVDAFPRARKAGDEDEVYEWAQSQVRRFYQWLVLNVYLPGICDPQVVAQITQDGPVLYRSFLSSTNWTEADPLPIPMEFSGAAFRFGHSMVRGAYDWNENFGRGDDPLIPNAPFDLMFVFTGRSPRPFDNPEDPMAERLPQNWGADWDRLVQPLNTFADRSTRKVDTNIARPLSKMENEGADPIKQNLLARNLRRGVLENLPSAQAVSRGLTDLGLGVEFLTEAQLKSGTTAGEVAAGQFHKETPLWFYTLKEAEILGNGQQLGPLASQLVASTLIGLIEKTPDSILSLPGSVNGKWHPVDGPRVSGQLVDSFPALIRAALLSHNPDL